MWIGRGHTVSHTKLHDVQLALSSGAMCMHAHVHVYICIDVTTGMCDCVHMYVHTYVHLCGFVCYQCVDTSAL